MIIVNHKVNSLKKLGNTPLSCGVEVDLRDYENKLLLNHEPFSDGLAFEEFLKHYNHKLLILNIKSEGIEERALKLISKYNIKDNESHSSNKTKLLGLDSKNRISNRFWQKVKLLNALAKSPTEEAPRSYGDQRLLNLITRTLGIGARVYESSDALHDIRTSEGERGESGLYRRQAYASQTLNISAVIWNHG